MTKYRDFLRHIEKWAYRGLNKSKPKRKRKRKNSFKSFSIITKFIFWHLTVWIHNFGSFRSSLERNIKKRKEMKIFSAKFNREFQHNSYEIEQMDLTFKSSIKKCLKWQLFRSNEKCWWRIRMLTPSNDTCTVFVRCFVDYYQKIKTKKNKQFFRFFSHKTEKTFASTINLGISENLSSFGIGKQISFFDILAIRNYIYERKKKKRNNNQPTAKGSIQKQSKFDKKQSPTCCCYVLNLDII